MSDMFDGYDDWKMNGSRHVCVCGTAWYDSDGGPCHDRCEHCGEVVLVEDLNSDGLCDDCNKALAEEAEGDTDGAGDGLSEATTEEIFI